MPRHSLSAADLTAILSRLTSRDHALITVLGDHDVLTTLQLQQAFFGSASRAQTRLMTLYRLGLLERWRTRQATGSLQWRYTLSHLGARLHAAAKNQPVPTPSAVAARILRLASSPKTPHLLGVNDFFTRILCSTRTSQARLTEWLPETTAADLCGQMVRPDAAATYACGRASLSWWFEHDRGTEPLATLESKIDRYLSLSLGTPRPVLFEFTSPAREDHFHQRLTDRPVSILVATTHTAISTDPTTAVWRRLHGWGHTEQLLDLS